MKKLMTIFGTILFASFILTSCGSSDKKDKSTVSDNDSVNTAVQTPKTEPPRTVAYTEFKIANQDKALFKMVEGGSTDVVINNNGSIEVTAKFELIKTFKGKTKTNQAFVSLVPLDSDGTPIKLSINEMRSDDSDGKQFLDFIMGEPGSKVTMVFTGSICKEGSFDSDVTKTKEAAQKIAGFKVLTDK